MKKENEKPKKPVCVHCHKTVQKKEELIVLVEPADGWNLITRLFCFHHRCYRPFWAQTGNPCWPERWQILDAMKLVPELPSKTYRFGLIILLLALASVFVFGGLNGLLKIQNILLLLVVLAGVFWLTDKSNQKTREELEHIESAYSDKRI